MADSRERTHIRVSKTKKSLALWLLFLGAALCLVTLIGWKLTEPPPDLFLKAKFITKLPADSFQANFVSKSKVFTLIVKGMNSNLQSLSMNISCSEVDLTPPTEIRLKHLKSDMEIPEVYLQQGKDQEKWRTDYQKSAQGEIAKIIPFQITKEVSVSNEDVPRVIFSPERNRVCWAISHVEHEPVYYRAIRSVLKFPPNKNRTDTTIWVSDSNGTHAKAIAHTYLDLKHSTRSGRLSTGIEMHWIPGEKAVSLLYRGDLYRLDTP